MTATNFALVIEKGRTLAQAVRWESEPFLFAKIKSISNSSPVLIETVDPHGIPEGWRVAVVGAKGLTSLNASGNPPKEKDFHRATVKTATSIEFNPLNTELAGVYTGSGALQFYSPVPLGGYIARLSVKNKVGGTEYLSLTTLNGGIEFDLVNYVITLKMSATDTAAISWKSAVYDLELESPLGVVTAVLAGSVSVVQEITT